MQQNRRNFLLASSAVGVAAFIGQWNKAMAEEFVELRKLSEKSAGGVAQSTALWDKVRSLYVIPDGLINLNNAGVSPQPVPVQDHVIKDYRFANELPVINLWEKLDEGRPRIKAKLAGLTDCKETEIAINRNATEGLSTVIFGLDLKPGDEVILSPWDYESMRHAWQIREQRHGIVLRWAEFDLPATDDVIFAAYQSLVTPKTKVIHLTHMLHYNGQTVPVKRICNMARGMGIQTVVDAAQSYAQMPVSFRDLECDYLATSLHKWLCAPFGTGMLIIRENLIAGIWPLIAPFAKPIPDKIDKLDGWSLGTYSSAAEQGIEDAIDFHNALGSNAVHQRLAYLTSYWRDKVKDIKGLSVKTPVGTPGAIVHLHVDFMDPADLVKRLRADYGIITRFHKYRTLSGIRVSPHIYTRTEDLDYFVKALREIAVAA